MQVEVKVPSVGESISEIFIGRWHKAVGDAVELDQPLVELESDKATIDVPAPARAVIAKIHKQPGEMAEVGEVIAHVSQESATEAAATPEPPAPAAETPVREAAAASSPRAAAPREPREESGNGRSTAAASPPAPRPAPKAPAQAATAPPAPLVPPPSHAPTPAGGASRAVERRPMTPLRRVIAERLVAAQQTAALLTTFNEIDMSAAKQL
ncbi:MAG TPA: biotin/lipoyl-containing protein, partial [Lacipirellulaceae bacterium]|nr:biotin/lipoyl-containing protein [Lacipirellulaceae bacterium]